MGMFEEPLWLNIAISVKWWKIFIGMYKDDDNAYYDNGGGYDDDVNDHDDHDAGW